MNKLLFSFLSCSILSCSIALDVTKIKDSFKWHGCAITQKIKCIENSELKKQFNDEKAHGKSLQISKLIALTRTGLPANATLQSLGINGLDSRYVDLINAKSLDLLVDKIGKENVKSWKINNPEDEKKLNTFFGFVCAMNARTQDKTFSWQDMNKAIASTIRKLELKNLERYSNHLTNNLWHGFNSWEIHALDHVLREEKTGVRNSSPLENAGNSCFFNASMQAVYACKPLRDFITQDLKDSKDEFVVAVRKFLNAMDTNQESVALKTGTRGENGSGLAYNVLQFIKEIFTKGKDSNGKSIYGEHNFGKTNGQEDSSTFLAKMFKKIEEAVKVGQGIDKAVNGNQGLEGKFENLIHSYDHCTMTCPRKEEHKSISTRSMNGITVEITNNCSSVQKLFACNLKVEEEVEYTCEICGTKGLTRKKNCITSPAKILPVSLKRFKVNLESGNKEKDDAAIIPNQILHVYDYIHKTSYRYILNSFVVHSGGLNGGHYYAYQRIGNTWRIKNDSSGTPLGVDIPNYVQNGYIFFYERLDDATL